MSETLSVRLDPIVKKRLEALANRCKRSKSFLAAEAIAGYVETQEWQLEQIYEGLKDLDNGDVVSHEKVSKWLQSWGTGAESKPPR